MSIRRANSASPARGDGPPRADLLKLETVLEAGMHRLSLRKQTPISVGKVHPLMQMRSFATSMDDDVSAMSTKMQIIYDDNILAATEVAQEWMMKSYEAVVIDFTKFINDHNTNKLPDVLSKSVLVAPAWTTLLKTTIEPEMIGYLQAVLDTDSLTIADKGAFIQYYKTVREALVKFLANRPQKKKSVQTMEKLRTMLDEPLPPPVALEREYSLDAAMKLAELRKYND